MLTETGEGTRSEELVLISLLSHCRWWHGDIIGKKES